MLLALTLTVLAQATGLQAFGGDVIAYTGRDERAETATSIRLACGRSTLVIESGYGDAFRSGSSASLLRITLNRRRINPDNGGLRSLLGRRDTLYKYVGLCLPGRPGVTVRFYTVSSIGSHPDFAVGTFHVSEKGAVTTEPVEHVPIDSFWFG